MHLMFSIYFTLQLILNHIASHATLRPLLLKSLSSGPSPACSQSSSDSRVDRAAPAGEGRAARAPRPPTGQGGSRVRHT